MTLLILYLSLAILVSFLCSILEAVLLSITPSYVESLKQDKNPALGFRLKKLKEDVDRPLAAILSFNTIAHTVGAAGVGAQAAKIWGSDYLGIVSAVLTLLILIFSEIIPKTIGANFWRSLTGFAAATLNILIVLMYPLVLLSQLITKVLSRGEKKGSVSRAEVSAMADIAQQEGLFAETESKMIKNLVMLRKITVEDIMTPRTVMVMVQENQPLEDFINDETYNKFSRIPVYCKNRDDITGYVHRNDVLTKLAEDQHDVLLRQIKRNITMVPNTLTLPRFMDKLIVTKEHMALVTDRYGGVSGLVTMEDVMETILGQEIVDEFDSEKDMQEFARRRWRARAKKTGLILEEDDERYEEGSTEKDNVIHYGITGGQEPLDEDNKD